MVELARRHLGLRRAPGLRVRVGDGRAVLAGRPDGSADAVLVDAFVGAQVPRHLVTAEALADLARVAGLAAVNVVDTRPFGGATAIAAGLRAAFGHVLALGARRCSPSGAAATSCWPARTRCRRSSGCARGRRRTARRPRCSGPEAMDAFIGGMLPWRD